LALIDICALLIPAKPDKCSIIPEFTQETCFSRKQSGCDIRHPLPRPRYRWYGALFKQASSDKFDKVVVVLIQSNWRKSDGRFADDQNAATEIGLRAIKLLRHSEEER
jgi:hypothetical protein